MKKFLMVLIALLFTAGAFAQNAGTGAQFNFNVYGLAYGAMGSVGSDDTWDYQKIRIRPMITAGNENIQAVLRLQVDRNYGAGTHDDQVGTNDRAANVKVQYAYLQAKDVFVQGLTFTTGYKDYFFPLIADTELALTGVTYDFGMGTASLFYAKVEEGEYFTKESGFKTDDDVQAYILDVTVKAGNIDVRPAFFFVNSGKDNTSLLGGKDKAYIGAVNATGDMGMFDFEATAAYLKYKVNGGDSLSGYAIDLGVNVKPDKGIVVGVFANYLSGTDGSGNKAPFTVMVNDLFGYATDGRLFLLQTGGTQELGPMDGGTLGTDKYRIYEGNMSFGLNCEYTMDKFVFFVQYGYMQAAKKNYLGNKNIGQEVDVKVSYNVAPKTSLFLEYGYAKKGDDGFLADNAQQILWGLTTNI